MGGRFCLASWMQPLWLARCLLKADQADTLGMPAVPVGPTDVHIRVMMAGGALVEYGWQFRFGEVDAAVLAGRVPVTGDPGWLLRVPAGPAIVSGCKWMHLDANSSGWWCLDDAWMAASV